MNPQKCCLCGGEAVLLHVAAARPYFLCRACDLVVVPREWHLPVEDQRARYLRHRNSIDDAGYTAMLRRAIVLLQELAPHARRVLDYGCGPTPVLVELLRREGYEATGFDPLFAGDADLSRPFDAVASIETFEHFADPRREIERVRSLVVPGGYVVVQTRLHRGPESLAGWWYARDATHVAFYSRATFDWIGMNLRFRLAWCDDESLVVLQT